LVGFAGLNGFGFFVGWLEFGLGASALTWLAARGIDWIIRGFRFPG
jgi:hypothetical protein